MKNVLRVLGIGLFIGLTGVNWSPDGRDGGGGDGVPAGGTRLTPVTSAPVEKRGNLIWCATFQMAWDRAKKDFGKPIMLEPASKLADDLNLHPFDPAWVDDKAVFVTGGSAKAGVEQEIAAGMKRLGAGDSELMKDMAPRLMPGDLVFFAALKKDLAFPRPFGRLGNWKLAGTSVPCFGFSPEHAGADKLREQVKVHHYGGENDFVIELLTKDAAEQLVLARLPERPSTLDSALTATRKHLRDDAPDARWDDLVVIPNMCLAAKSRFSELEGKRVRGNGKTLTQAMQLVDFRMDEQGVRLRSEAAVSFGCAAQPARVEPRRIVVKPPFVIMMKRRAAPQPYFAAWVANGEPLRKPDF
ncbi:MAG: hypothetical protein J0M04_08620 [Verrucomicrobia bacterium]|nr:hypothetical protein [Verrucomicrobiota bacterium]